MIYKIETFIREYEEAKTRSKTRSCPTCTINFMPKCPLYDGWWDRVKAAWAVLICKAYATKCEEGWEPSIAFGIRWPEPPRKSQE